MPAFVDYISQGAPRVRWQEVAGASPASTPRREGSIRGLGASLSFRAGCRCGARPVHVRSEWRYFCLSSTGVPGLTDRAAMDPNTIIEALRGTMDPALREAAERQLNEVRTAG